MIFDSTPCELGEGALWHPGRKALFWFDILHKRLHMKGDHGLTVWDMPELTSAAGILSDEELLLASESALWRFDIATGKRTHRVALDADGWPKSEPEVYLDLTAQGLYPDGAVVAVDGTFWNAQWGAGRVAAYAPDGTFLRAVEFEGSAQTSCPAFGGEELTTLFCTSALEGMDAATRAANPNAGNTFSALGIAQGLPEPVVIL